MRWIRSLIKGLATPSATECDDNVGGGASPLSGGLRVLLFVLSFFVPIVGVLVGIILINNPLPENRRFGKWLLIYSLVIFVLLCICGILAFAGLFWGQIPQELLASI
ncbi:MAG: hypothetical protein FH749_13650 [Firmicutes bacterium]|nr:hypothetical protein [Bacillota bacterium]